MLRIKEGVKIEAYGPSCEKFDSNSKLSQESLEHLKERFPDAIEEVKPKEKKEDTK